MPNNINVELRTHGNSDGTYNVGSYENSRQLAQFSAANADCAGIRRLHSQLVAAYPGVTIAVAGPGAICLKNDSGSGSKGDTPIEAVTRGLNALEHLRQAGEKLPESVRAQLEQVKEHVRKSDYGAAKTALLKILAAETNPPEEMWIALTDAMVAVGDTDVKAALDYIEQLRNQL